MDDYLGNDMSDRGEILSFFITFVDLSAVKISAKSENLFEHASMGNGRGLHAMPHRSCT